MGPTGAIMPKWPCVLELFVPGEDGKVCQI